MAELILGTAQLGMDYGINNQIGKPSENESYKILNTAFEKNIKFLDTAKAYGESQRVIGDFICKSGKTFEICTKINDQSFAAYTNEDYPKLCSWVEEQLNELSVGSMYCLYLHSFEMCKNKQLMDDLVLIQRKGLIDNIGISIYEPNELRYILDAFSEKVQIVQIPLNILNAYAWINNSLLDEAKQKGICIYVRSVYLQGLLLMEKGSALVKKLNAEREIGFISSFAAHRDRSIKNCCLDFVATLNSITGIIVGCETEDQLLDNIEQFDQIVPLTSKELEMAISYSSTIPSYIYDPRVWNKYIKFD